MGLFDKLFSGKPKEMELGAPVAGEAVPIQEVKDPTFGDEILGKGMAIKPTGNQIVSPCDATVDLMFETGHAVSLKGDNGAEILIHVGLETVSLGGKHFKTIKPTGNQIVSPCDATVDLMFETGHAVSLKGDNGAEILIHVGLETVSLGGKHFKTIAKTGDHVTKGQLLIEFDREAIAAEGLDTITPMVICNTPDYHAVTAYTGKTVAPGDTVLGLMK